MATDMAQVVGERVRAARVARGWSAKELAAAGELALNTISLIERGKISPSVATLQKLGKALEVPLAFFVEEPAVQPVAFHRRGERREAQGVRVRLESLGNLPMQGEFEPLLLTMEPGADSGPETISHGGCELVFCLEGQVAYQVGDETFIMEPEDSLFFAARLPHAWRNLSEGISRILLVAQGSTGPEVW